ncbi:MAG: amidohydrolase family protein, partial [Anaerotruncus massiliensis (ex Togo et al. 2019)]
MLVLKNCRLIPALTEGYDLPAADLVLDGELIADIRPAGGSYEDAPVLDMAGKTVLPGLFDLHTHLHSLSGNLMENQLKDFGTSCFDTCEYANTYLKLGYTTVRDMGSNSRCAIAVRNAVQKGQITGPRIYIAGLMISPKDAGNEADGREAVIGAVREEIA